MDRREQMLSLKESAGRRERVPAAFFLHFGSAFHSGRAAVDKHVAYFRHTGMDFVKVQFERRLPEDPSIHAPGDWSRVRPLGVEYFGEAIDVVRGLVEALGREALVIVTLYSPFMLAGQIAGRDALVAHMSEDPDAVRPGLDAVTETLLGFVRGCIAAGADGFYASTQGGEEGLFRERSVFTELIKPSDLRVWDVIAEEARFNILHVCDYHGRYADFSDHLDYPGDVVNCGLELTNRSMAVREAAELFSRPFMGGLDRHGAISGGDHAAIREATRRVLAERPDGFVLGADCTVPAETDWDSLKVAIETAHDAG